MEQKVAIKQVSDKEIMVGENRVYLRKDNIVHFIAIGDHDENLAIEIDKAIIKLGDTIEGKVNLLIDLNKAGKPSPEAMKIWHKSSELEKNEKTALFGLHPVARMLASFSMSFLNKKKIRFFKTKEEALTWLKE